MAIFHSKWFFPVLIVLSGVAVYANSLHNGFTFDDWPLLVQNPLVERFDIGAIFSSPYWVGHPEYGLYRPLTTLSYAVNRMLLGEGAAGFHGVNIALHIVNAMLVFVSMRRLLNRPFAGVCALTFLLLPLQTEAVNSIVGRAELLAAFWMLMAWMCFLFLSGWGKWGFSALAIFLGCLCKEHAAMMVGILAFADVLNVRMTHGEGSGLRKDSTVSTPLKSTTAHSFISRLFPPFSKGGPRGILLCVFAVGVFFALRYAVVGAVLLPSKPAFVDNPLAHVSGWERVLTALTVIWYYVTLLPSPGPFSADYSFDAIPIVLSVVNWRVWVGAAIVGALIVFMAGALKGHRQIPPICGLAASWIVFPALPVSNLLFPIGTVMAERLMYVLLIGFALGWGWGFQQMALRWPRYAFVIGIVLFVGFGKTAVKRNFDWQNDQMLFASAVVAQPQSAKAHFNLGNAVRDLGNLQMALEHYDRALAIYPQYAEVYYNIGVIYQQQGQTEMALSAYQKAIEADSVHVSAWNNLGVLLGERGDYQKAVDAFLHAVGLKPDWKEARDNLKLAQELLKKTGIEK